MTIINLVVVMETSDRSPDEVKQRIAGVLRQKFGEGVSVFENDYKLTERGSRVIPINSAGKNMDETPDPHPSTMIGGNGGD